MCLWYNHTATADEEKPVNKSFHQPQFSTILLTFPCLLWARIVLPEQWSPPCMPTIPCTLSGYDMAHLFYTSCPPQTWLGGKRAIEWSNVKSCSQGGEGEKRGDREKEREREKKNLLVMQKQQSKCETMVFGSLRQKHTGTLQLWLTHVGWLETLEALTESLCFGRRNFCILGEE